MDSRSEGIQKQYDALEPEYKNKLAELSAQYASFLSFVKSFPLAQGIKEVYKYFDKLFIYNKDISCSKGCSFCCYQEVTITNAEANYLKKKLTDDGKAQLRKQKGDFSKLSYQNKRCAFLVNDLCSVYDDRPMSCRKYFVVSDPSTCDIRQPQGTFSIVNWKQEAFIQNAFEQFGYGQMHKLLQS